MAGELLPPPDDDGQPWLIPDLPADPAFLREKADVHTGARVLERMDLAQAIVEHWILNGSERASAKTFRVSRNTVSALVRWFADHKKLEPLFEKMAGRLKLAAARTLASLDRDIEEGRLKPEAKAFALGVLLDNAARLATAAGPIATDPAGDQVAAWLEQFKAAKPPLDVQSEVQPPEPKEITVPSAADTGRDTPRVAVHPDLAASASPPADNATGAGGGSHNTRGGQNPTDSNSEF
jgi:hypothetical protein